MKKVTIIGGGLAGSEAAFQLAERGVQVTLYEMRPVNNTPAHKSDKLAELVCSNSFKAEGLDGSSGLIKAEMEMLNSLIIKTAKKHRVPAGGALAVNREDFSNEITSIIENHPNITIIREEVTEIPKERPLIIATGPLTSDALAEQIKPMFGGGLHFFDAMSPIVDADSIDYSKGFFKNRYGRGDDDYLNLPMNKEQYENFYNALMAAEKVEFKDFEKLNVFEGCMPVEEMASRGQRTLTFGPLKPVGLEDPETDKRYYAVVQLRKENREGTAYNLVGFQTKMKIGEQKRVFGLIPGLENAEYLKYGSIHRNTYVSSPEKLSSVFKYINNSELYFAGQLTGVEGYIESTASGLIAALALYSEMNGQTIEFPRYSALGSLGRYVAGEISIGKKYVPSNFHFGMLPAPEERIRDKKVKKKMMSDMAIEAMKNYIAEAKLV